MTAIPARREFSGGELRKFRVAAGLKPERLAMMVDKSVYTIHRYEQGTTLPPVAVAALLADVLGVTVDQLIRPVSNA